MNLKRFPPSIKKINFLLKKICSKMRLSRNTGILVSPVNKHNHFRQLRKIISKKNFRKMNVKRKEMLMLGNISEFKNLPECHLSGTPNGTQASKRRSDPFWNVQKKEKKFPSIEIQSFCLRKV